MYWYPFSCPCSCGLSVVNSRGDKIVSVSSRLVGISESCRWFNGCGMRGRGATNRGQASFSGPSPADSPPLLVVLVDANGLDGVEEIAVLEEADQCCFSCGIVAKGIFM